MKKIYIIFLFLFFVFFSNQAIAKTDLIVYTAVEPEQMVLYKKSFESAYPDINIVWVRESSGVITAKLLAEKDNPKADAVFGLSAMSILTLKNENLLQPYKPEGYADISLEMKDNSDAPYWVAMNVFTSGMAVNNIELKKHSLPAPKSWKDLINPKYKNHIVMPAPDSSGTGYLNLVAWIQMWGEDKAWEYADALVANTKMLTHSGSKPGTMAAQGEVAIGIGSPALMSNLVKHHAPIDIVAMEEGVGWEAEASCIIKTTKKIEEAKKLMDWTCSKEASKIAAKFFGITGHPEFTMDIVKQYKQKMIKNDLEWAANNRSRLLKKWRDRYSK